VNTGGLGLTKWTGKTIVKALKRHGGWASKKGSYKRVQKN